MPPHTRREALALLGAAATAGCLGGDGPGTATANTDRRTDGSSPTPSPTGSPTSYGPTPAAEPWIERITVESGPATASTAAPSPGADAWPSAKRDLAATASAPAAAAPDPPLAREVLATTGQESTNTPAVDGDVAVVLTGSPDATLLGLDPTGGETRWSRTRDDLGHASPALAGGTAFVPWGYYKRDEHVTAVDAATGADRWEADVGESPACDPVVADGTVYAGTDGTAVVTALDAGSGERCFRLTLPTPSTAVRRVAVVDGRVYAGTLGFESDVPDVGHVLAFDPASGEAVWARKTDAPVADLAVADGTVAVGTADRALALDAATGRKQWSHDVAGGGVGAVAVDGDGAYLGTDGTVRALTAGGDERWRADAGGSFGLAVAGGTVYAGNSDGLAVVDAAGTVRWRDGGPMPTGGPVVAGGRAYVGTADGRLLGYAPNGG